MARIIHCQNTWAQPHFLYSLDIFKRNFFSYILTKAKAYVTNSSAILT